MTLKKSRGVSPRMKAGWENAAGESPRRFASSPDPSPRTPWQVAQLSANSTPPRAAEGASGGSGSSRMPVRSVIAAVTVAICETDTRRRRSRFEVAPERVQPGRLDDREPRVQVAHLAEQQLGLLDLDPAGDPTAGVERLAVLASDAGEQREEPTGIGGGVAVRTRRGRTDDGEDQDDGQQSVEAEGVRHGSILKVTFNYFGVTSAVNQPGGLLLRPPPPAVSRCGVLDLLDAALRATGAPATFPALGADAVELHPVAAHDEAEEARDALLQLLELLAVELDDLPAALADDVVVVLLLRLGGLVARLPVVEVALVGQAASP